MLFPRSSRALMLAATLAASAARAEVFVLSGGDSPAGNHYSQYLQTKLLTDELRAQLGADQVDVRFGAGNNYVTAPQVFDVHRIVSRSSDGRSYHVMSPGMIEGNAPATKAGVHHYFETELPARPGVEADAFFLFVTDHGMPNENDSDYSNNCIDLWGFDAATMTTKPFAEQCLSQRELRSLIKTHVPARRTIFAMTQCFSGGFHEMSVSRQNGYPVADVNLCGFTAVTPDTTASGCTPDVDGPGYKGYERYLAQQLTGKNVVNGQPMAYARKATLKEAHLAAALEDTAKDIPFSTSDHFLVKWARTIAAPGFQPRTETLSQDAMVALYRESLDTPNPERAGPLREAVVARQQQLAGTIALLRRYDPELRDSLEQPLASIETKLAALKAEQRALETEASALDRESSRLWMEHGFKPWKAAVSAGVDTGLDTQQRDEFELGFMTELEQSGAGVGRGSLFRLAVWSATQPSKAAALSEYVTLRDPIRTTWLDANSTETQSAHFERIDVLSDQSNQKWTRSMKAEEQHDQLRRVLYLRQQIAAAIALGAAQDQAAVQTVLGLEECERTPF